MKNLYCIYAFLMLLTACNGPQGNPGINGSNGGSCSVSSLSGSPAAALIQCEDGTQALILNGSNGTVIQPIQLCPGQTSYPNVFPEVAFLIDGKLYAVYSANDGFLTYLPPGNYHSNAIGNSCNFTVTNNGTIQH